MFRLLAIFRELTTKQLKTYSNKIEDFFFFAVSFKLLGCELPEDGDQPKNVGAR
jgi:hypothetical protein